MGMPGQYHTLVALSGGNSITFKQVAGWAPGPVWTGVENLARTGVRFLDSLVRSQSLHQQRHTGLPTVSYKKQMYLSIERSPIS
jgi:hypothetical protein